MFKRILFIISIFISFSIVSNPICSINKELNKDTASKLKQFRPQAINTCLSCTGGSCVMKAWPKEKKGDETVCKILFCTPVYVSKVFKKPDGVSSGKTRINFNYIINEKGKVKDIDIISAKGVMNSRESYKYLQSFVSKTKFIPLTINNNSVRINELTGEHVAITGDYEDVEKNMPVDKGVWRN